MGIMVAPMMFAAVTAAAPTNARDWITPDDYPTAALREGRGGYVGFRLTVSAEGRPTRCEIVSSSGSRDLDETTCAKAMRRARFRPAENAEGAASISTYDTVSRWWSEGARSNQPPLLVDMQVALARMPTGIEPLSIVTVALAVDAEGAISECTPRLPDPPLQPKVDQQRLLDALGAVACQQVLADFKPKPAVDASGQAVASIQNARVQFGIAADQ